MSDTFGRIADDELASLIARATGEEEGGKRPHTWGLIRSALLELEQHRAALSVAKCVPGRPVSDAHLVEIVRANLGCLPEHRTEALEMALELQQHRAAIARVEALIAELRKPAPDGQTHHVGHFIAAQIEAALRGERSGQ